MGGAVVTGYLTPISQFTRWVDTYTEPVEQLAIGEIDPHKGAERTGLHYSRLENRKTWVRNCRGRPVRGIAMPSRRADRRAAAAVQFA